MTVMSIANEDRHHAFLVYFAVEAPPQPTSVGTRGAIVAARLVRPGEWRELHASLLRAETELRDELADALVTRAFRIGRRQFSGVTPEAVRDACTDAVLAYFSAPSSLDPGRAGLPTFIWACARRGILQRLRSAQRRSRHEIVVDVVPDVVAPPGEDPATATDRRAILLATARNHADRAFIAAWLNGASAIELGRLAEPGSSPVQQGRAAHRWQERLRIRWKRKFGGDQLKHR